MNYWLGVFLMCLTFSFGVILENAVWEERVEKLQPFAVDGVVYKVVKVEVK